MFSVHADTCFAVNTLRTRVITKMFSKIRFITMICMYVCHTKTIMFEGEFSLLVEA